MASTTDPSRSLRSRFCCERNRVVDLDGALDATRDSGPEAYVLDLFLQLQPEAVSHAVLQLADDLA